MEGNMFIRLLGSEELSEKWGEIKPEVNKALSYGDGGITSHALFLECLSSKSQCWVLEDPDGNIKGVAITRYINNSDGKELCIVTTTAPGYLRSHGTEVLTHFEDFARGSDCVKVSILGRKGWRRFLPEEYEEPYVTYIRRL